MTIRHEMLRAAREAPKLLKELAPRVVDFVQSCRNPDGGFRGRSEASDLYYTVFGLASLRALGASIRFEATARYLEEFGVGEGLDVVHLACLARCWASLTPEAAVPDSVSSAVLSLIESYRSPDGGYRHGETAGWGTAYAAFLALGAYQDLGRELPRARALVASIEELRTADGAYGNGPGLAAGTTPVTAAAVTVRRCLGEETEPAVVDWLFARCLPGGGFFAMPQAPVPDLLSTATALHALAGAGASLRRIREPSLDFLDSLWSDTGGFRGTWADPMVDCEYTYYGLLALGHLCASA